MSIEKNFDIPFVADLALREKQIQQNYRPVIAVHKWFARRPGTLFRALLLSEFVQSPLRESFFRSNNLKGIRVADPFMGGGTPLIEANRVGCDTVGYDINPMAYWIVRQEIENLDVEAYREAASDLVLRLNDKIGRLYRTKCVECGSDNAQVKYFLWVKVQSCRHCGKEIDVFPGYLVAEDRRHPINVFVCSTCKALVEVKDRKNPGGCTSCKAPLQLAGPAKRNHCACPECGKENSYPVPESGPPQHRMFAIEYYCSICKASHRGRFFKKPDDQDLHRYSEAESIWAQTEPRFAPDDKIPPGDETNRLHRWGYGRYREMFNARQLLGLELSCQEIDKEANERIRSALATNLSDLLRYQNMLCRYDSMALKSLDIFSVHGFPVGLVQCESNLLGISNEGGTNIGSGGWTNIIEKYAKAKSYCDRPFEIRYQRERKILVHLPGEWIGIRRNDGSSSENRQVSLYCQSATAADLPANSLDAVLTDPPYFGNVQYAELMDFCYVWLRRLMGQKDPIFKSASTRHPDELTGNVTMERGFDHFTQGLSSVFQQMASALRPDAPFVFTYHHNRLDAYYPIAVALLDAGLICSASIPCPAEMAASIHINGTTSSIIDTIFVCRLHGKVSRSLIVSSPKEVADLVHLDLERLREGNVKPTRGDIRCITYGHLIRLAVWNLRISWEKEKAVSEKLDILARHLNMFGGFEAVQKHLTMDFDVAPLFRHAMAREGAELYEVSKDEISF
jgi:adenine-specific DNA methylase